MRNLIFGMFLLCAACAEAPATPEYVPAPAVKQESLALCSPTGTLKSFVTNLYQRPSSDCYNISFQNGSGGFACNQPFQFLPYVLVEIPRQVYSPNKIFGDVSACYSQGDSNSCFRWFRARCACGAGCTTEALPENQ